MAEPAYERCDVCEQDSRPTGRYRTASDGIGVACLDEHACAADFAALGRQSISKRRALRAKQAVRAASAEQGCSHTVTTNLRCDACGAFLGVPPWTAASAEGQP